MKVNIGDKVKFLNQVGGGIVSSFINKEMVKVEDEDGFEIPVLIKELLVEQPQGVQKTNPTTQKNNVQAPSVVRPVQKPLETRTGEALNVILAYIPHNTRMLSSTDFDCFLLNESNYYLSFVYLSAENQKWKNRYKGVIAPNSRICLETFSKEMLNELEHIALQFIAYKEDKTFDFKPPVSVEVKLDVVKFYKLHTFRESDYFQEPAYLVPIMQHDAPVKPLFISAVSLEEAMSQKIKADQRDSKPIVKKSLKNDVLEIDLHISELLDSTVGLSNSAMLMCQLDTFHQVMAENRQAKGQKIVFIHGKGEGVLRKAIEDALRTKYRSCSFQDASFAEYGFGATMVTIC